ncbi:MAG TPA: hypothetical protein VGN63_14985 [Flavisolibacter sp.]|jgi:hypothetical protein|nr:hypothetical protein [Flavisolibacter sp.]
MMRFHEIRRRALESWAGVTGRKIADEIGELASDNFAGAFECKWQNAYQDKHVNLFCSLGEWGCNITDILRENRYDYLDLTDESEAKILFRYYSRFLLVLSEMLTDFQDIYIHLEKLQPSRKSNEAARQFYSQWYGKDIYTEVLNFINCVCKHKTQHIHSCNNHNKIIFEDAGVVSLEYNYVRMGDCTTAIHKNAILVPYLHSFTNLLASSYHLLDEHFRRNQTKFEELCEKFSG